MLRVLALAALSAVSADYCNAGNTVAGDSNLGKVHLTGVTQSIDDPTNCPGKVGLQDKTDLDADLHIGTKYALNFQATTCDTGWQRLAYAYIDFNANQAYEPSELVGQIQISNQLEPFDVTFEFTPPLDTSVVGKTRMRVFVVESGFTPNPCLTFSYGGVKEFSITLKGHVPPPPTYSCCLPTTFSSVARIRNGALYNVVSQYQDLKKQAYLQRTETRKSPPTTSSLLCLASAQACFVYTANTCDKYTFIWPAHECPGSNTSKFVFDSQSEFIQGLELTIFTQPGIAISTVPLQDWCVYQSVLPNTVYTHWDLNAPDDHVFEIPAWCEQASKSFFRLPAFFPPL